MRVCEQGEFLAEVNDHDLFSHVKVIVKGDSGEYYFAKIHHHIPANTQINPSELDLTPIPPEHIWPQYNPALTRVQGPRPADSHVKRRSLLDYAELRVNDNIAKLVLAEARACQTLRAHPHPNIARYLGCIVINGRIKGLCFTKYRMTLEERVRIGPPLNVHRCLRDIENGIRHLHGLGLTHNDIHPRHIMVDGNDKAVIISMSLCKREGEPLLGRRNTPGWVMERANHATPANDLLSLSQLREYLHRI